MNNVRIKAERRGPVCVLAVSGELDAGASAEFTKLVQGTIAVTKSRRVVIDLSGLRFIDCGGTRALAAIVRSAPADCPVMVRSVRPVVRRVLDLMCLDLDVLGPNLDLIAMDVEHVRGRAEAVAESPTGRLVQRSRMARFWSAQTIADSRRAAHIIAATEERMAASLIQLASQRPTKADELTALSDAMHVQALRMRDRAGRTLPA